MINGPERLRAWMERSKLNQRQTADLLGVHEVYISQILSGIRTPGLENAINIEEHTGIPVRCWSQSELSESKEPTLARSPKRKIASR